MTSALCWESQASSAGLFGGGGQEQAHVQCQGFKLRSPYPVLGLAPLKGLLDGLHNVFASPIDGWTECTGSIGVAREELGNLEAEGLEGKTWDRCWMIESPELILDCVI